MKFLAKLFFSKHRKSQLTLYLFIGVSIICPLGTCAQKFSSLSVGEKGRLDPFLHFVIDKDTTTLQRMTRLMSVNGQAPEPTVDILIRTKPGVTRQELNQISSALILRTQAGDIFTAVVPISSLTSLATSDKIIFVSAAQKASPSNNVAKSSATDLGDYLGVSALSQGLGGYRGVEGQGVVVGVVDSGIDFRHPDFLTADNKSRLLFLWDQTTGAYPGTEWTKTQLDQQLSYVSCRTNITNCLLISERDVGSGHGTHVVGSAAGGHALFSGTAPKADIIFVKTDFIHYVDGVHYVFDYAESLGKPAVVNLSLQSQYGPHDGTSNEDRGIFNLIGPGKLVVAAGGNARGSGVHYSATIAGTNAFGLHIQQNISSGWLDLWHSGLDRYTVSVKVNNGASVSASNGNTVTGPSSGVSVTINNAAGGANPNNSDNEVVINLDGNLSTGWPITVTYTYTGGSGTKVVNGWCSTLGDDLKFDSPNDTMLIGSPGSSAGTITVGAYVSRNSWQSTEPNSYCISYPDGGIAAYPCAQDWPLGAMSSFSSPGPTRDGRIKPDISAPGAWIMSTLSQSASPEAYTVVYDGAHMAMPGTSMASPIVTGLVALQLQENPTLTLAQMKAVLVSHARKDSQTEYASPTPNYDWGYGKILGTPPAWPAPTGLIGVATSTVKIDWHQTVTAQNQLAVRIINAQTQTSYGDFIPTTTAFSLINLSTNTLYSTQVSVVNEAGASTSTATNAYTLAAQPLSQAFASVNSSSASVKWAANQNPAWTYFTLEASGTGFPTVATSSRTLISTATVSLIPNTSYYFRVKAENGQGIATAYTPTISTVTLAAVPLGLTLTRFSSATLVAEWPANSNPSDTQFELSFSSTNFITNISTPLAFSPASAVNQINLGGLAMETTYYARVRARNRLGTLSGFAAVSSFIPTNLTQSINPALAANMVFGNATLAIPPQAFPQTQSVTMQMPNSYPAATSLVASLAGCNSGVDITTDKNLQPEKRLTLTLTYSAAQATGLDESKFLIARYEPSRAVWVPYASTPNPATNQVTALIDHLSLFQIMMATPASSLSAAAIKIFPNPVHASRGQTMKFTGLPAGASIKIYTFQGELVRELITDASGIAQWDGRNAAGQQAASEVYLALIKAGGDTKTLKVMVER